MRDLKKRDVIIVKLNTIEKDWMTYIPSPTALGIHIAIELIILKVF